METIVLTKDQFNKRFGMQTIQSQVTIMEKMVDGRKVTYIPSVELYPYPTQANYTDPRILVENRGNGYDERDSVYEAIQQKIVGLDYDTRLASRKQIFIALQ